jgi:molybdopterin-synthase adenylyltransferase
MEDQQLLRYSRQIMLPYFDVEGQEKLQQSTILIMGMGGLGSPVAMYLAAAGVGHLILCDFDRVELSNLQRQIIHSEKDIDKLKITSAKETIQSLNSEVKVTIVEQKLNTTEMDSFVKQADLVIEGTDNFTSRFLTNQACVNNQTPFISGAVIRMEGQLAAFSNDENSPCLQCLFPAMPEVEQTCSENGVLSPVVGMIGSIQATEAIKILAGIDGVLFGQLLIIDAQTMDFRKIKFKKDVKCPACGHSDNG